MLKVTSDAFHEKVNTGNEEIILNGPPSALKGHMFLRNGSEDMLSIKTLSLLHDPNQENISKSSATLRIGSRLRPGEEKLETISHELPAQTPPGTYESLLLIGGEERKIKMIVQPHMEVNIYPISFSFIGSQPGQQHTAEVTITNMGNLPFQVPDVKHVATLDMDLICRAFGFALRSKGAEGYGPTLDEISRNVNRYLPDWAAANVAEYGQTLQPGETRIVHLTITMPENTDAGKDYTGSMRFWNQEINYEIKSQNESTKAE
ncbi:MAG: hypothetical protein ABIR19_11225 [Ginsengibacter sp.]